MKNIELKELKVLSVKNRFLDIDYKALDEKNGSHTVAINDGFDSIDINKNSAKIIFTRTVQMDDDSLFKITIKVESIITFEKDDKYTNNEYKNHFSKNCIYYYRSTTVASTISLIVGQITAAFGRNPLLVAFKDK